MPLEILRLISSTIYRQQALRWGSHKVLGPLCNKVRMPGISSIITNGHSLSSSLRMWHSGCLTNLLQYGDAISMSVNLEARCPFLDYRLVDFCFRLPLDEIYKCGVSKWILRESASGSVPDSICWNRRKDGFSNPTITALRSIKGNPEILLRGWNIAVDHGIFKDGNAVQDTINDLPDNIYYRAMSVILWAAIFYGKGAIADQQQS